VYTVTDVDGDPPVKSLLVTSLWDGDPPVKSPLIKSEGDTHTMTF